ncbi:MAG: alanine racemase [Bacteroidales bacterium]
MFQTSYIEISKSAYKKNIRYLKKLVGKHAVISSVVKGNAYGHGIKNIVPLAEDSGIHHFSVFSANEALQVCKSKSMHSSIMIMGLIDDEEIEWAIKNDVEFFVFDPERLAKTFEIAKKIRKRARLHIEVETGFHRTGFDFDYMPQLFEDMKKNHDHYYFEGLCTHYAGAESITNYVRIRDQISLYRKFYRTFQKNGLLPCKQHTACSAAVLNYPTTIMDMVRIGISQYGFWPSPETKMFRFKNAPNERNSLTRLISWKSRVMVVKTVEPGEYIGYGTTFLANKRTKIAIIPIGYSNGYPRMLSNSGRVIIRGKRVPVIGTITMNTMTVNVSDVPSVERGDEVVIIGKQKRMDISVASFSEMSNQVNYQTLTRIPTDIPRYVVD